ncbi:Transcriptional regulator ATRX [Liparis tanakae]|uniref:Transcriptional regulator ATRX n=1 Tax=Liparis tanakae TaxID=230148 RepID=A0A4Z2IMC9_9TELE|nr:Transcriptional regulator ATRX [Liparis tanakae]
MLERGRQRKRQLCREMKPLELEGERASMSGTSQSPECWFKNLLSEDDANVLEHSGKMVLLFEILRMAEDLDDKVGRLFLISTRAGSLGINLVAANRVIIFDASWNPSNDIQSIYRVYRFGQLNQVFVYRFLAQGTMEEKIYDRQVTKQSLANRVVDQQQIERHYTLFELTELYTFEPDMLDNPNSKKSKRSTSVIPKDIILARLLQTCKDQIVAFHEHESLLDHKQEEELSEAERKDAWAEYEAESSNLPAGLNQNTLDTKTNEELVELLNKSRRDVSVAFESMQTMSHPVEVLIAKVVSDVNVGTGEMTDLK